MNLYEMISTQRDPILASSLEQFVEDNLAEFKRVLFEHPLQGANPYSISVSEAFWLHSLVKAIAPSTVVESGSYAGYSLYFIKQAAPLAKVIAFDPYTKPVVGTEDIEYHACDWMRRPLPGIHPQDSLVFFDDHVHQGKRLRQAWRRGFRHVLFHDNYATPYQSHVPIRYCNLIGYARLCFVFERLRTDRVFVATDQNPQNYRWLTYLELEPETSVLGRITRRVRAGMSAHNPYQRD